MIPKEGSTRIEISMLYVELHPKKDKFMELKILMHSDPKLWFAPNLLINYIFKKIIGTFLDKILKFSETIHEKEWGKRMQTKKEFYDWLRTTVDIYLQTLDASEVSMLPQPQPSKKVHDIAEDTHSQHTPHHHHSHHHAHRPGQPAHGKTLQGPSGPNPIDDPDDPQQEF